MIQLREYQEAALTNIWNYFVAGNTGNPLIAHPTGVGKSILPAVFIERILKAYPTQRFILLSHVSELIRQNAEVLLEVWPNAPLGIYSAGLKAKQSAFPIVYAGIQSAIKNPMIFGHRDIGFVDEAHLVNTEDSSMYLTFLATMKLINPHFKVIGMSATPFRMGQGYLTDPLPDENGNNKNIFTDIIHDLTGIEGFNRLIAEGYLCPLIPLRTQTELDVSNVGMQKHEFVASQLQSAVDKQEITYAGLKELVHAGQDRKSWLLFSSGIEHAEHIAAMLSSFGIDCAAIHSKQKPEYNDAAISAFKSGKLRSIVNFSKLTTGFNHPDIDLIGDFRPTMSIPLHIQKLGRGTRQAKDKSNCIAKGSLVLTDVGLIPIEKISLDMKLWDGVEFISHDGVIYKGKKETIEYVGLRATLDHFVASEKGWQTFGKCFLEQIEISITGNGSSPIRKTENYFTRNSKNWKKAKNILFNKMSSLFTRSLERLYECSSYEGRLSSMRKQSCMATASKMASVSLYIRERQMHKQKQSSLYGLWWSRHSIQIFKSYLDGNLDYAKFGIEKRITDRSNAQRLSLRNWKFKILNSFRKYAQQSKKNLQCKRKERISVRPVYDILNAGPRNRFTVNNLLVHNCLVLDFSRNVPRLGPINDPVIPRRKGEKTGDVPIKLCDNCGAYNHASARICCQCGEPFSFQVKIVAKAGTDAIIASDLPLVEPFNVDRVIYAPHNKLGSPQSMKVTYFTGLRQFKEWILFEHPYPLRGKAKTWWKLRHTLECPKTTGEALQHMSELKVPKKIKVWLNKKPFAEVIGWEF